jgi:hypothetical protein
MDATVDKLISLAEEGPSHTIVRLAADIRSRFPSEWRCLEPLLRERNGFLAFQGALHVFSASDADVTPLGYSLGFWNSPESWRRGYDGAVDDLLFFAQDVFGEQFGLSDGTVCRFNPETGRTREIGASLGEWAARILRTPAQETGFPLAEEWQWRHGRLKPTHRLIPKVPFTFGGDYDLANLYAADVLQAMRTRATIWRQTRHLPPGTRVRFRIT